MIHVRWPAALIPTCVLFFYSCLPQHFLSAALEDIVTVNHVQRWISSSIYKTTWAGSNSQQSMGYVC